MTEEEIREHDFSLQDYGRLSIALHKRVMT